MVMTISPSAIAAKVAQEKAKLLTEAEKAAGMPIRRRLTRNPAIRLKWRNAATS